VCLLSDEREITCSCTKQGTDATDFGSVTAVSVDITAEAQYKTVPVGATVVRSPLRVNRAVLTARRSLPIYPNE
jgi:hypothetical protein